MRSSKDIWFEAWDDYYAKTDSIRERYACQIQDARDDALIEQEYHDYMNKVHASGYGTDTDAYEAYWTRTLQYYEGQT